MASQLTADERGRIGVYIPTLGRPSKLAGVLSNLAESTSAKYLATFVVEPHDAKSLEECREIGADVVVNPYESTYSNAIQTAFELRPSEFFLNGNDDFDFQPGWAEAALLHFDDPRVMTVGLDDGFPERDIATIHLVRRSYIEDLGGVVDMPPGRIYYPYEHNYVDPEFWETAEMRGVTDWAREAQIKHLHAPSLGWKQDETYQKGQESAARDGHTFELRRPLWGIT